MEFLISRTLSHGEKPCREAKSKEFIYIDRRTVKTLAEARLPKYKHWSDAFFASGTNHREENGMIARDCEPQKKWVVNIDTLEDLIKFEDKYNDIILSEKDGYHGIKYSLEIYDGYRE